MSATRASRVPVSALNSVDLPTFGRPTRATTGSMACVPVRDQPAPRGCGAPGLDFAGIGLQQQQVACRDGRVAHAVRRLSCRARASGRSRRRASAGSPRSRRPPAYRLTSTGAGERAAQHRVLGPHRRAVAPAEGHHACCRRPSRRACRCPRRARDGSRGRVPTRAGPCRGRAWRCVPGTRRRKRRRR